MALTIISLFISIVTLVIVLKERTRRPFEADLADFRAETERLIAEFNRVAERNISMMDDRIEALERQTRIARKIEDDLSVQLEQHKLAGILPTDLEKPSRKKKPKEEVLMEQSPVVEPLEEIAATSPQTEPPEPSAPETPPLFDGFPVQRLRSYGEKRTSAVKSHEQLLQYLKENKTKDELIDMGFSSNEINLAILSISLEENTSASKE
ncbi:MAG: hypothetical protein ACRCY4_01755 [Brevinema sp.]